MADLTRKDIRQGTVTRLRASTQAALLAATVYDSRIQPIQPNEGRVVIVSTPNQRDEQKADGQPTFTHLTTIIIESHVTDGVDPTDPASGELAAGIADDIDEAINVTLFTDPTWIQQFGRFVRNEHSTGMESKGVLRAVARTFIEVEGSRIYKPDPAYYSNLEGVDVTTRIIDDATDDPIHANNAKEQEIDLPTLP